MSRDTILPLIEPEADMPDRIAALLRALGIAAVTYSLDGGGDSGETSLEDVAYVDRRTEAVLPPVAIGFRQDGRPRTLDEYLGDLAADLPEGDWVNNEGGYGTVSIQPFASFSEDRFTCDMTYRDGYDEDEPDDDDEEQPFEDVELDGLDANSGVALLAAEVLS